MELYLYKAFPGRAAILIKILGLTEKEISSVYEIKGSIKQTFMYMLTACQFYQN